MDAPNMDPDTGHTFDPDARSEHARRERRAKYVDALRAAELRLEKLRGLYPDGGWQGKVPTESNLMDEEMFLSDILGKADNMFEAYATVDEQHGTDNDLSYATYVLSGLLNPELEPRLAPYLHP